MSHSNDIYNQLMQAQHDYETRLQNNPLGLGASQLGNAMSSVAMASQQQQMANARAAAMQNAVAGQAMAKKEFKVNGEPVIDDLDF